MVIQLLGKNLMIYCVESSLDINKYSTSKLSTVLFCQLIKLNYSFLENYTLIIGSHTNN